MIKVRAGIGVSTIIADFDFETYSPAGFHWDAGAQKWIAPPGLNQKGLFAVGACVYSEHPEAEVLSLAYDLKDGRGGRRWQPGYPLPLELFHYLQDGGLIEAWNASFEIWIWNNICIPQYKFPELPLELVRCAAAKARAFGLPGSLEKAGQVLNITNQKLADGKRLINKFCIPRSPTKFDKRLRINPVEDAEDAKKLYEYNIQDIKAEAEISKLVPDLNLTEQELWLHDQAINKRGVGIDLSLVDKCISIVNQAYVKYNAELSKLTSGEVTAASQIMKLQKWLNKIGIECNSLDAKSVQYLLNNEIAIEARRALEIRKSLNSAAIKKLFAMKYLANKEGRICDNFIYHGARTGRFTGSGLQLQNFPNSGPLTYLCNCGTYYTQIGKGCYKCGDKSDKVVEWNPDAVDQALKNIQTESLEYIEYIYGNGKALDVISGCLRGLITAKPGHVLIGADYSAIEAVVLAALSEETWRLEVFRTHGKIYEASASKITGESLDVLLNYSKETGQPHPSRKLGKVAELASGYGGGLASWKVFGADKYLSEDQIKNAIQAWRKASPNIVNMWYRLEDAAKAAILNPGLTYSYKSIKYYCDNKILYCILPSGRTIVYHNVSIEPGNFGDQIFYWGWNTNPANGQVNAWIKMGTWGGKFTENVVQAVARDILTDAIVKLEEVQIPIVLHVHDEVASEIPEEDESLCKSLMKSIMSTPPKWAKGWPIRIGDIWSGKRYRK